MLAEDIAICQYCMSIVKKTPRKRRIAWTEVSQYYCKKCRKRLVEGEVIKIPICQKCQKPMRLVRINKTKFGKSYLFKCECGNHTTLAKARKITEERSPICPYCGHKSMIERKIRGNKIVLYCKKCQKYTTMPEIEQIRWRVKRKAVDRPTRTSLDDVPKVIRKAIKTKSEYWIKEVRMYSGSLKCPYCGGESIKKGKRTLKDGSKIQKYKCKECHRHFTPLTYLRLAEKSRMPCCPYCGTNNMVVKNSHVDGRQLYKCKRCKRSFLGYRVQGYRLDRLEAVREYVSSGKSVSKAGAEHGYSGQTILRTIRDISRVIAYPGRLSGILIADEKKVFVDGKQRYYWAFVDLDTRLCVYSDVTKGRGMVDALRGYIAYSYAARPRVIVTDGHPCYARASVLLFAPKLAFVFWNKTPGERFPLNVEESLLIVDDYGDHVIISMGAGRKVPIGKVKCSSDADLAGILASIADNMTTIVVNSGRSFSSIVKLLDAGDLVFHFICGKGYLKAYVERFLREPSRRLSWFARRFKSLESARAFSRVYAIVYNFFRRHRSLSARPADLVFDKLFSDPESLWRFILSLPILDINKTIDSIRVLKNNCLLVAVFIYLYFRRLCQVANYRLGDTIQNNGIPPANKKEYVKIYH